MHNELFCVSPSCTSSIERGWPTTRKAPAQRLQPELTYLCNLLEHSCSVALIYCGLSVHCKFSVAIFFFWSLHAALTGHRFFHLMQIPGNLFFKVSEKKKFALALTDSLGQLQPAVLVNNLLVLRFRMNSKIRILMIRFCSVIESKVVQWPNAIKWSHTQTQQPTLSYLEHVHTVASWRAGDKW